MEPGMKELVIPGLRVAQNPESGLGHRPTASTSPKSFRISGLRKHGWRGPIDVSSIADGKPIPGSIVDEADDVPGMTTNHFKRRDEVGDGPGMATNHFGCGDEAGDGPGMTTNRFKRG